MVEYFNGIEGMAVRFCPCPPYNNGTQRKKYQMATKKNKTDQYYSEEKIAKWTSCVQALKDSITDLAAQISCGDVDLEGSEFIVALDCMELNRRQIANYRSLIEEEKNKK